MPKKPKSPVRPETAEVNIDKKLRTLESNLKKYIDSRIEEMQKGLSEVAKVDTPPLPPKKGPAGKAFAGSKKDIRALIDSELWKLFDNECRNRFGGNQSRALDAILWHYFGKPKLSFEVVRNE